MTSNSKITREQKAELKEFKASMGKNQAFGAYGRVTVFASRVSQTMAQFSVSIASREEEKIRPKVGQYWALERFYDGQHAMGEFAKVWTGGFEDVAEFAQRMAEYLDID